jgi:hypothetical protein
MQTFRNMALPPGSKTVPEPDQIRIPAVSFFRTELPDSLPGTLAEPGNK